MAFDSSLGISAADDAMTAITKLYNHINLATISTEDMFKKIDVDGDGDISPKEYAEALYAVGVGIEGLEDIVASIDMGSGATASAGVIDLFAKIEKIGGLAHKMVDRVLAKIAAHLCVPAAQCQI